MTTRGICWGLLGVSLAFGQTLPAPPERGNKTLADRMGELSGRLNPGEPPESYQKALNALTGSFARKPRALERKVERKMRRPEVCAAPLLEVKPPAEWAKQFTMRVVKPREPLSRMPQLEPPAPRCPSPTAAASAPARSAERFGGRSWQAQESST